MKIETTLYFVRSISRITAGVIMLLCVIFAVSGCSLIDIGLSKDRVETPAYNLQERQGRKVMVWVERSHSSNADYDVREILSETIESYMIEKAKFAPENIIKRPPSDGGSLFLQDPQKIAHSKGAGYLLFVQVDSYETDFLHFGDNYAGDMISHTVLYDTDLGVNVWPEKPGGKMIHIGFDMGTKGRDVLKKKLTSSTAHCVIRDLYPCKKVNYNTFGEKISSQEAFEIGTF